MSSSLNPSAGMQTEMENVVNSKISDLILSIYKFYCKNDISSNAKVQSQFKQIAGEVETLQKKISSKQDSFDSIFSISSGNDSTLDKGFVDEDDDDDDEKLETTLRGQILVNETVLKSLHE